MLIIVKKSEPRVDPKRPGSHPGYEDAVRVGQERIERGELTFESEGQRRDYIRAISANPNNVPGLPAFYPAIRIRTNVIVSPEMIDEAERIADRLKQMQRVTSTIYCEICKENTEHSVSPEESYCRKCGTFKAWRTV